MKNRKKWIIIILGLLSLIPICVGALLICGLFNVFHAHEHCIKMTGGAFRSYAGDNQGRFPYDTNGFGNALLLMVKGGYLGDTNGEDSIHYITGPGDDGHFFREALKTGSVIPEQQCSRIYVQGLSETNDPQIAILWDKKSTPGGDHFRRPWGPPTREVCMLDGAMECIRDEGWAAFSSNQVELLVQAGIPRTTARHYYYEIH